MDKTIQYTGDTETSNGFSGNIMTGASGIWFLVFLHSNASHLSDVPSGPSDVSISVIRWSWWALIDSCRKDSASWTVSVKFFQSGGFLGVTSVAIFYFSRTCACVHNLSPNKLHLNLFALSKPYTINKIKGIINTPRLTLRHKTAICFVKMNVLFHLVDTNSSVV